MHFKLTTIAITILFLSVNNFSFAGDIKHLPKDPDLRMGTLENGLHYYVRHNEEPHGMASFHLVQNVGSILEEDNERGLAHFLEHMCFNGTRHFPENSMIRFLERNGVRFAADLNAYTSIDETIYSIDDVPSARQSVLDSCLLIMRDWCDGLLLSEEEIDKERGVILEEWRSHEGPTSRMYAKILPVIYPDSCRYSNRMPIGDMDVIMNFEAETLRNYYKRWSRPELQCVVAVGDFDADRMEERIRSTFSGLAPAPSDAPIRPEVAVPDNGETPVVAYAHDKVQTSPIVYIYKKQALTPKSSKDDEDYEWMVYIQKVMDIMIAERLGDILKSPDCNWLDAAIGETDFFLSKTKGAWMGVISTIPEMLEPAIQDLYREMKRIEIHGFTRSEYERARLEYLSRLRRRSMESSRISSTSLCSKYERNFLDGENIMSATQEYELVKSISEQVDVSFVNFYCKLMPKSNITVIGMLPEGLQEPDAAALIAEVEAEEIEPNKEAAPIQALMGELPVPGKLLGKAKKAPFGYAQYRLSNGAKLYVKNTDFNENQIQIRVFSPGGTSMVDDEDILNINDLSSVITLGGLGDLPLPELSRSLSGKQVSITPEIGSLSEGLYGASTVEDFESLLQLTYLYFTAPRKDSTAYEVYRNRRRAELKDDAENPQTALNDSINLNVYGVHPRGRRLSSEDISKIDYNRQLDIIRNRYADASDFTFILTGHFDEETMMPLVERYIASLPSTKGPKEKYIDRGRHILPGKRTCIFHRAMPTPSAAAVRIYSTSGKYNLQENLRYELMGQCLNIILTEEIREKMSSTYAISAKASFTSDPIPVKSLQTIYQTDPLRVDEVDAQIDALLEDFAKNGPSQDVLDRARQYKIKRYEDNKNSNAWFSTVLREYLETGVDFCSDYVKVLMTVTKEDLAAQLNAVIHSGNEVRVSLLGFSEE